MNYFRCTSIIIPFIFLHKFRIMVKLEFSVLAPERSVILATRCILSSILLAYVGEDWVPPRVASLPFRVPHSYWAELTEAIFIAEL